MALLNNKSTSASQLHRAMEQFWPPGAKYRSLLEKRHYERQMVGRHTRQDGRIRDRRTPTIYGPTYEAAEKKAVAPPHYNAATCCQEVRRYCAVAAILCTHRYHYPYGWRC